MNDGHRTAACGLLRTRLLLCGLRLMMDFGKAILRNAEYGRTGSFTQAAGNTAASFDCNVHTDTLLSEIQFAPFPMIYACLRRNSRTSSAVGTEGAAPVRETARADAAEASCSAVCTDFPALTAARKYPQKVSPAAVVSTAFTLNAGS